MAKAADPRFRTLRLTDDRSRPWHDRRMAATFPVDDVLRATEPLPTRRFSDVIGDVLALGGDGEQQVVNHGTRPDRHAHPAVGARWVRLQFGSGAQNTRRCWGRDPLVDLFSGLRQAGVRSHQRSACPKAKRPCAFARLGAIARSGSMRSTFCDQNMKEVKAKAG